jgi:hypothetical protein
MAKISEVCRHVRSKNAGPFWVTVDFFFKDAEMFDRYAGSDALGPDLFARLFDTDPGLVKRIPVKSLSMVKVSYARPHPQGWMGERDMHQGQSFARLLNEDVG